MTSWRAKPRTSALDSSRLHSAAVRLANNVLRFRNQSVSLVVPRGRPGGGVWGEPWPFAEGVWPAVGRRVMPVPLTAFSSGPLTAPSSPSRSGRGCESIPFLPAAGPVSTRPADPIGRTGFPSRGIFRPL